MAAASVFFLATLFACVLSRRLTVESNAGLSSSLSASLLDTESAFVSFLTRFNKNYTGASFTQRLAVFEQNLILAVKNQLADPSAEHGVTRFSDMTTKEFESTYLGYKDITPDLSAHPIAPPLPVTGLPAVFDWRDKGAVTPVKDQGMCGSCYAFSAVGAIESAHFLKTGSLVRLSEQQVVDCDSECDPSYYNVCDSGCMGGLMNNVVNYVMKTGGLQLEADYPYTGFDGTCKFDKPKAVVSISNYAVVANDEDQMAANLIKNGPLAIAINAAWMQTYVRGVSCPIVCNKKGLNHGVILVGYGTEDWSIARLKRLPYWTIKNSWGESWGEDGYYRVCRGKNMCGLENMVTSVVMADLDGKIAAATDISSGETTEVI